MCFGLSLPPFLVSPFLQCRMNAMVNDNFSMAFGIGTIHIIENLVDGVCRTSQIAWVIPNLYGFNLTSQIVFAAAPPFVTLGTLTVKAQFFYIQLFHKRINLRILFSTSILKNWHLITTCYLKEKSLNYICTIFYWILGKFNWLLTIDNYIINTT